jgi:hypothetical protein
MCTRPELHLSFIHQLEVFVSAALGSPEYQAGLFILSSLPPSPLPQRKPFYDPFLLPHFFRGPKKTLELILNQLWVQNVIANKF